MTHVTANSSSSSPETSDAVEREAATTDTPRRAEYPHVEYPPLGPDSLTWQVWGTWTGMIQGLWAGSIQNMHPKLGQAVWDLSLIHI